MRLSLFDAYLFVDWNAANRLRPRKASKDAPWVGESGEAEKYFRGRRECVKYLRERLREHLEGGRRVLLGFDFAYGYPAGYADALGLTGEAPPWRRLWDELVIDDNDQNRNNRFDVAEELNARCGEAPGPLWGLHHTWPGTEQLRHKQEHDWPYETHGLSLKRLRLTDESAPGVQEVWKLFGNGSVGSQALTGIPYVRDLRDDAAFRDVSQIWPFETGFDSAPSPESGPFVLHVEVSPGLIKDRLDPAVIKDQAQVRAWAHWAAELDAQDDLAMWFDRPEGLSDEQADRCVSEEGWILGTP
jgi:hypothetical protein